MNVNCQQHRKTMELLGLKIRLKDHKLSPKERAEIVREIKRLEKELKLD